MSALEQRTPLMDWGLASVALAGEKESGDRHVVRPFQGGVLVGAVDGLGHGDEAAAAAKAAIAILEAHAGESLISLFRLCHEALVSTRGAVMSLASINAVDATVTWLGVGNLSGVLLRAGPGSSLPREYLLLRGGVVGYQLPELRAAVVPVERGDTLIFATDGVRSDYAENVTLGDPPQQIADRVLSRFAKSTDDALVLVARLGALG